MDLPATKHFDRTVRFKWNKRKCFLIMMTTCLTYYIYYLVVTKGIPKYIYHYQPSTNESYVLDLPGCRMPSFPVFSEYINQFLYKYEKVKCLNQKHAITYSDNECLWIGLSASSLREEYNIGDPDAMRCYYRPFHRRNNDSLEYFSVNQKFRFGQRIPIPYEFVKVWCDDGSNEQIIHTDFHAFVHQRNKSTTTTNSTSQRDENKLNVMIIGIDSLSRLNFQRQLRSSYDYIMKKLDAIEFKGYNKLADNTYPNLIPALTGMTREELNTYCLPDPDRSYFDNCDNIIWSDYAKNGYQTGYAEDVEYMSLFTFYRAGFNVQPTDYFTRPYFWEMEQSVSANHAIDKYLCDGRKRPIDYLFDYIEKFAVGLKTSNHFSFFWSTSITHDDFNIGRMIDDDLRRLLVKLNDSGDMEKTVLFLMSDHGIRFGEFRNSYQGMMEERLPYLYMILPKTFRKKYPWAVKNAKVNQLRLTTHFDLHETLKDLATLPRFEPRPPTNITRGMSLFSQIPESRTCSQAGIAPHWCTCHERETISLTNSKVKKSADFVVKKINAMLANFTQCHPLELSNISEAFILRTNSQITKSINSNEMFDITIHVTTTPGDGSFESTLRLDDVTDDIFLTGTISRTNVYGNQSHCINDTLMKLYCYCKDVIPNKIV